MELRQLRYLVAAIEQGSLSRAAASLGVVTSALSQQITRLEGELSTRLLHRNATGVAATDAGLAFLQQAQLALRHVDDAARAAKLARLSGHVSIGLATTTARVLGLPLLRAMRQRYPDVRLHLVESLSGHLAQMLNARQLDLAVVFSSDAAHRWTIQHLLDERLFVIGQPGLTGWPARGGARLAALGQLPLVLPSASHNLRTVVDAAFVRARTSPRLGAEIDGLALLMATVMDRQAATVQPGAALAGLADHPGMGSLRVLPLRDAHAQRANLLVSLSEDELSPAALAARVVMRDVARQQVLQGHWAGASLHES
jgi:LysR family tcuABC transcriptional regulator